MKHTARKIRVKRLDLCKGGKKILQVRVKENRTKGGSAWEGDGIARLAGETAVRRMEGVRFIQSKTHPKAPKKRTADQPDVKGRRKKQRIDVSMREKEDNTCLDMQAERRKPEPILRKGQPVSGDVGQRG